MDQILERLWRLIKSESPRNHAPSHGGLSPEEWEAYQELERELNNEKKAQGKGEKAPDPSESRVPIEVADAYRVLEIPVGSSWNVVQKAYKLLVMHHHPDRHAQDPQKYKAATEKTQKINQAFQIIKNYLQG